MFHHLVETTFVDASPDAVWAVVGDPAGIAAWMPGVASTTVSGDERRSILAEDGETVVERIIGQDSAARSITLEYLDGPWVGRFYSSELAVRTYGERCNVVWHADFQCESPEAAQVMRAEISAMYRSTLAHLAAEFAAGQELSPPAR